ncbi:MAG: hypothetical protein COA96_01555 [SAR86 cluster bacterium]|uniref:DUF4136 domain-containing protein n=1 Tax=SAR86 cluster bacterium TaxID=2030880 RepID=A0A2A5BA25_9GAMM|nr:MAG: hypothetical protein COA96_01555 [SAR86 cluster bacterium]
MKHLKLILLSSLLLILSSCAQTGSQIGTTLTLCCPENYASYSEYGLEVQNMPLFLRSYMTTEFESALQQKGLSRNDQINDIRVILRYKQIDLVPGQQEIDPFIRIEALNVELNYIARIEIEIFETRSNDLVWAGSVSRIHQVTPGEYMHEDRARPHFYQAFQSLLASYPALTTSD